MKNTKFYCILKPIQFVITLLVASVSVLFFNTESLHAQFGRNKVQYQKFEWKYIQSKHFDIYFAQGGQYLAEYASFVAEDALNKIEADLRFKITQRVVVIVYNSHNEFQQTNSISSLLPYGIGGVTELFKNRMVLPYEGNWEQFRHVIHHELVHAVLNDMFYGGSIQNIISNGIRTEIPIWMNEGLAEFESLDGYDAQTDMFMRDITQSEFLSPLQYLDGYMAYRGGQSFYWYVSEKYGREKIGELMNRLKTSQTVDAAFRGTFRMNLEEFSEKWIKEMKKKYWPDLAKYEDPDDYSTRITEHKKLHNTYNTSPSISPNGEKMVYIADEDYQFNVYVMDLKEKKARKIITGQSAQDFEELNFLTPGIGWNPEGTKFALPAKAGGEDALFIVDVRTEEVKKFKFGLKMMSTADWSPDGKSIVFVAAVNEQPDLYVFDVQTAETTKLTDDIFTDSRPLWSPDGKTVYFISDRGNSLTVNSTKSNFQMWHYNPNVTDIYAVDVVSKAIRRITNDPENKKTSMVVSTDNTRMLYVSEKNGIGNIYELNFVSGQITPKTNSLNGITQLSMSRDASKMLFVCQNLGGYDIFMLRFPFDKTPSKEPELTEFRKRTAERQKIINQLSSTSATQSADTTLGYGNFDIDFSRQKSVVANPESVKDQPSSPNSKATDDTHISSPSFSPETLVPQDYKINFSSDVILGTAGYSPYFGFQGQTQMLFSDMLGDHQLYFQANLLYNLQNSDFFVAYDYLPKMIDYEFTAFHTARYLYRSSDADSLSNPPLYRFRYYGFGGKASLPMTTFDRFEGSLQTIFTSSENIDETSVPTVSSYHFVPEIRYVHDNSTGGLFAPVKGSRFFIALEGTPKLSASNIGFATFTADYRHYFLLSDYLNFAVRASGGASFGPNPQRFFLGGTENWLNYAFSKDIMPYNSPEDFIFNKPGMPLRGFDINQENGSKYFIANAELRFPLFRALLAGPIPILFQSVQGAFFYDVGSAWDNNFSMIGIDNLVDQNRVIDHLMMSTGIGIRMAVLGFPLKIDIAWANLRGNTVFHFAPPRYLFSLGYDF